MTTIKLVKTTYGEIETLASYRVFKSNVGRLRRLYYNSIYAYQITREEVYTKIKAGKLQYDSEINFNSYQKNNFIIGKIAEAAHNLRTQHPRYLRELIFIRLISALEVFLIDSIKETVSNNKKTLKSDKDDMFNLSMTEFLSYSSLDEALEKYILRKCRNLQSQGYEEIKKFYMKKLEVDFAKSTIKNNDVCHYHDQRHLLVHTLGKTDPEYKHKYNTIKKEVDIEESYLLKAFQDVSHLVLYINDNLIIKVKTI